MFDKATGKSHTITGQYIKIRNSGYITLIDILGKTMFKVNDVSQSEKDPLNILDIIRTLCDDQEYLKAERFIYERFI
ncbi:MAG: hypothetical protein K9H48_07700 [Melioribacteraceae bacterium]|nr:hypothetical protein [Melioribacteraceae bacterium]